MAWGLVCGKFFPVRVIGNLIILRGQRGKTSRDQDACQLLIKTVS